jgi:hypothetical protein
MYTTFKVSFFSCLFLLVTALTHAQVGIGTSDVNASARLQVDATNKGFLPPRVALQGTNDAQLANPSSPRIISPATGLLVYNTATAGSGATAVTPGFYYYDGAKWQRIINQQPDATVTFDGANPNSGTNFSGTTQSRDFIYVSNTDNSQWTWNGSTYVTYVPPPSTPWMLSGGTSDAGSNKTGAIYRTGRVGIGTNNPGTALEVSSGVANNSGLRFTNLNSATATSAGATLGVDASGNVVTVQGSSFSPSFGSVAPTTTINVNAGSASLLASITLPTTGTYLINYTMRVQATTATANQYAVGYLSNSSAPGTPIAGTEILGAFSFTAFVTGGNYSGTYVVTVTSAPQSLHFIGAAIGGQMGFLDDANGRTRISYVKVTP